MSPGQGGQTREVTRCKVNQTPRGPSSSHHSSPVHLMFHSPSQKKTISSAHDIIDIIGPGVLLDYSEGLMWFHQTYLLLFREVILLAPGTLPTFPAGLFYITKYEICLSCFLHIFHSYHTDFTACTACTAFSVSSLENVSVYVD